MRAARSGRKIGVKVRMYCHGLGDCFLLTFTEGTKKRHVMIDCGVAKGTADADQLMHNVVEDVKSETGGKVDVLAVTHEHWDHVSGFASAQSAFKGLRAGQVWLSWAENPRSEIARRLKNKWGKTAAALQLLAERTSTHGMWSREAVAGAMAAYGELLGAGATTVGGMDYVRKHFGKPKYLKPGQVLTLPGMSSVRVYVLAPPSEEKWLRSLEREGETYKAAPSVDTAFLSAAVGMAGLGDSEDAAMWEETRDLTFPFAHSHRLPPPPKGEPQVDAGGAEEDPNWSFFAERYRAPGEEWRAIDSDWLDVAGQLALALQSKTNNTSLVLAFELVKREEVLLFTGDAQLGNWLSWDHVKWPREYRPPEGTLATALLEKTVLYKVGHHGSHNATPKGEGLERMTHEDLVAMIPVDSARAKKLRYGVMPFGKLLTALRASTHGRVLESDENLDVSGWPRPDGVTEKDWKQFRKSVTLLKQAHPQPSYVEYTLP